MKSARDSLPMYASGDDKKDRKKTVGNPMRGVIVVLIVVVVVFCFLYVASWFLDSPDTPVVDEDAMLRANISALQAGNAHMAAEVQLLRAQVGEIRTQLRESQQSLRNDIRDTVTRMWSQLSGGSVVADSRKQETVVQAFQWAWRRYKECAWGKDEVEPVACKADDSKFGLGLTIVDAMDTMLLMKLDTEYQEAREWVASSMRFDTRPDKTVNFFETTIRVLGGLLAAYHLTPGGDDVLLERARELGDRLYPAFESRSGVPYSDVTLFTRTPSGQLSSTAEATTVQLEFRYLGLLANESRFDEAARRTTAVVAGIGGKRAGLVPIFIDPVTGEFRSDVITMGARGDSYYEYLLKQWIYSGGRELGPLQQFKEAIEGMKKELVRQSGPSKYTYIGELRGGRFENKMDHLVCFMPGTLALAHFFQVGDYLDLARELMLSCMAMYRATPLGLAPEIVRYNMDGSGQDILIRENDAHCLLRPETVESLFVLYRVTGEGKYREWGWEIMQALDKYARLEYTGYATIDSVLRNPPTYTGRDKMESFFLAETLKYLYLLFSDASVVPLDTYVLNTEAHPLPIMQPSLLPRKPI